MLEICVVSEFKIYTIYENGICTEISKQEIMPFREIIKIMIQVEQTSGKTNNALAFKGKRLE